MSWRQPYRSGLRDLAQSLLQQAETRRVNDIQENQLRLQADAQQAQATQQLIQGVGNMALEAGRVAEQFQQERYQRGVDLQPRIMAEAERAQSILSRAQQVRAENPNAMTDAEYAGIVNLAEQYNALLSKPVQELPDAWRDVRGSTFLDKGTPARLFSPEQVASGEAAAALNAPLAATDILSRADGRLTIGESAIADRDAQRETNGQLLNNYLSQMSVIGDANLNLEENPAAPAMAANAVVQAEALLASGAELPDSVNVDVIRQQITSTRGVLEQPLFQQALRNAEANLAASGREAVARGKIADANTLQAELDMAYAPTLAEQEVRRGELDIEGAEQALEAGEVRIEGARVDLEAARQQVAQLEFANWQTAFEAWRETGVVPQTTDAQGNPWEDQIRAQYESNPMRDDNGRALSFEEATQVHADRRRNAMENEARRLELGVQAAGIDVAAANIELDAAKYAAKYSEFSIDLQNATQVQDYVASAVANGDAAGIAALIENHPEALSNAGVSVASLEGAMARARRTEEVRVASDAARVAELNYAMDSVEYRSFTEKQRAMQQLMQEKANFMSPDALENWWGSLTQDEKGLFGDSPEAREAMLSAAKTNAQRREFLLQDEDLSRAWERVSALSELNPGEESVASFKVRVESILADVMPAEDAAAVADAVAEDWRMGNRGRAIQELQMDLQEQGLNATMAAIENGDVVWDADAEEWKPSAPAGGEAAETVWDPQEARLVLSERAEQRQNVLQSLEREAQRLDCGGLSGASQNSGRCQELSEEISAARAALASVDEDIAGLLSMQTGGSLGAASAQEVRVEAQNISDYIVSELMRESGALPVDAASDAIAGAANAAADAYGLTGEVRQDYVNRLRRQAATEVESYLQENSVVQTPATPSAAGAPPPRLDPNASRIVAEYGEEIASGRELVPEFYGQYSAPDRLGMTGVFMRTPFYESASRAVTNAVRGAGNPLEGAGDAFRAAGEAIGGAPGMVGQAAEAARESVLATTEPGLPENGFLPNTREDAREAFRNVRQETLEQFNPAVAAAREAVRGAPRAASRAAGAAGQSVRGAPRATSQASRSARDSVLSSLGLPTPEANPIGFPETEFSRQFGNAAEAARESIYNSLGIDKDRISPRETNEYTPFLSEDVRPEVNNILPRLIQQESGGRQRTESGELIESPVGALGKTQLMPETMIQPGYNVRPLVRFTDLPSDVRSEISRRRAMRDALPEDDPGRAAQQNAINDLIRPFVEDIPVSEYVRFAGDYLDAMLDEYGEDMNKALAAYNAGPGRVNKALSENQNNWLSLLPEETRNYVRNVGGR